MKHYHEILEGNHLVDNAYRIEMIGWHELQLYMTKAARAMLVPLLHACTLPGSAPLTDLLGTGE